MRSHARISFSALLVGAVVFLSVAPAAGAAEFPAIEKFAAVNCATGHEKCAHETETVRTIFGPQTYSITKERNKAEAEAAGFVKPGGHPPFGITDFKLAT